jgi:hypothetical protein
MKPAALPFTDHFQSMPCGTRAKYVAAGCRCPKCRAANSRYVIACDARAKAAARELATGIAQPAPQTWTAPDGTKRTRVYRRACQGVNGVCPYRSHLRKDSSGDVRLRCRPRLAGTWNGLVSADDVRAHLKRLSRQGVGYKSVANAADMAHTSLAKILAGTRHHLRAQTARRILAVDQDAIARSRARASRADVAPAPSAVVGRVHENRTRAPARIQIENSGAPVQERRYILAKSAARVERFYHIVMVA